MSSSSSDRVYQHPLGEIQAFDFNQEVTRVFPDMIQRSVPGYQATLSAAQTLAHRFARPYTHLYDLGCSRGAGLLAMSRDLSPDIPYTLIGIDQSPHMLKACQKDLAAFQDQPHHFDLRCEDLRTSSIENASMVLLNFTLQFIPIEDRLPLLTRIRKGMVSGGVLLLSEKIQLEDPRLNQLCFELHHDFKRSQGYSDLEIAQKRDALEGVLIPESIQTHRTRLEHAGFQCSEVWYQVFNFCSLVALCP